MTPLCCVGTVVVGWGDLSETKGIFGAFAPLHKSTWKLTICNYNQEYHTSG